MDPVDPRRVSVFNRPIITLNGLRNLVSRLQLHLASNWHLLNWSRLLLARPKPFRAPGRIASGVFNEVSLALVGVASPA